MKYFKKSSRQKKQKHVMNTKMTDCKDCLTLTRSQIHLSMIDVLYPTSNYSKLQ